MKTKLIALLLIVVITTLFVSCTSTEQEKEKVDSTALADAQKALETYLENTISGKTDVVIRDEIVFVVEQNGKFHIFNWVRGVLESGGMQDSEPKSMQGYELETDKENTKGVPKNVKVYIPVS